MTGKGLLNTPDSKRCNNRPEDDCEYRNEETGGKRETCPRPGPRTAKG